MVKSRTLAAAIVSQGQVRLNRERVAKPSHEVAPGDVLTLVAQGRIRVIKVLAIGTRRGPASEAQTLYEDMAASEKLLHKP